MTEFAELTDEQLADEICTWSGRVAAGEARLSSLIGEFDQREAWAGPGLLSCAHWLSWRTGLGLVAARERVRVARRLRDLPAVRAAFAAGRMSWSQVRAVTRAARPDDGVDWVDLARSASGAQIEQLCRGVRRAHRIAEAETDPEAAAHRLRTTIRYDDDGTLVLTVRAPAEDGAVILAGLEAVKADLDRVRASAVGDPARKRDDASAEAPGVSAPPRATDTDAVLELARRAVDEQRAASPSTARRLRARLEVQVDPLSGWARLRNGELLPPRPGAVELPALRPLRTTDLTRHDLGREQREVNQQLRDLLGTVDGERCRFPGCTRRQRLHAHHVRYWAHGGPTDLANLVLVCSRHHTIVHAQGFRLVLQADRRLSVSTAEGVRVLHHPALPTGDAAALDPGHRVEAMTLPPHVVDARLDLHWAVGVLLQQAA
jgi:hypothetical protein